MADQHRATIGGCQDRHTVHLSDFTQWKNIIHGITGSYFRIMNVSCIIHHASRALAAFSCSFLVQVTGGGRLRETPAYATAACFKRCNCGDGVPTDSTAYVPLQVTRTANFNCYNNNNAADISPIISPKQFFCTTSPADRPPIETTFGF